MSLQEAQLYAIGFEPLIVECVLVKHNITHTEFGVMVQIGGNYQ